MEKSQRPEKTGNSGKKEIIILDEAPENSFVLNGGHTRELIEATIENLPAGMTVEELITSRDDPDLPEDAKLALERIASEFMFVTGKEEYTGTYSAFFTAEDLEETFQFAGELTNKQGMLFTYLIQELSSTGLPLANILRLPKAARELPADLFQEELAEIIVILTTISSRIGLLLLIKSQTDRIYSQISNKKEKSRTVPEKDFIIHYRRLQSWIEQFSRNINEAESLETADLNDDQKQMISDFLLLKEAINFLAK